MTNTAEGQEPKKIKENPAHGSSQKKGKTKGRGSPNEAEEKVSVTFSFSPGFARQLRMAVSASSESASDYVQRNLGRQVKADLKKAIEGLVNV